MGLWQAYSASEEEWHAARGRYLEAIQAFNAAVRQVHAALSKRTPKPIPCQ
jgi:hypothetical protein